MIIPFKNVMVQFGRERFGRESILNFADYMKIGLALSMTSAAAHSTFLPILHPSCNPDEGQEKRFILEIVF